MTSTEVIDEIFKRLNNASVKSMITGGIYKMQRPTNSVKEDIVVNSLGMLNEQLQKGVVNVNVFVPDLAVTVNGIQQRQPNFLRLDLLSRQVTTELRNRRDSASRFWYDYQQDRLFKDENSDQHFINIRVAFYSINF